MNIVAITNTLKGISFEMREDGCECGTCDFCTAQQLVSHAAKLLDKQSSTEHQQRVQALFHMHDISKKVLTSA